MRGRAQAIARCYRRQHRRRAPRPAGGDQRGGSCRKGGGEQRRGAFAEPVATAASLSGADTVNELKATLEKQTVKQLKLELEKAGLDLKSKKSILVDRLAEHQLGAIAPKQRAAAEAQIGTMELDGPSATVAAESAVESFTLDPVASFEAELDSAELGPPPAARLYRPSIRRRRSSRISTWRQAPARRWQPMRRRRWRMRSWRARGGRAGAL